MKLFFEGEKLGYKERNFKDFIYLFLVLSCFRSDFSL